MRRLPFCGLSLVAVLFAFTLACSPARQARTCESTDDCSAGAHCLLNHCVADQCTTRSNCAPEQECDLGSGTCVPDTTLPTIISRTPAPGDDNVWVHAPIQVTFSEPVVPETVESSLILTGTGGVALARTLVPDASGMVFTITPAGSFQTPNELSVTLLDQITDFAGNHLKVPPSSWTFSMPTWWHSGRGLIGSPPGPLFSLAATPDGMPLLAWNDLDGTNHSIFVAQWDGYSWNQLGTPIRISLQAGKPSLAIGSSGKIALAWEESDWTTPSGPNQIYVAMWNGTSWTAPDGGPLTSTPGIASSAAVMAHEPSIAVDPSGVPIIAWTELAVNGTPFDTSNVFIKTWTGASWSSSFGVASLNIDASSEAAIPNLVLSPEGLPILAWNEQKTSGTERHSYAKRWTGSGWQPLGSKVDDPDNAGYRISLAIDSTGKPTAATVEIDSTQSVFVFVKQFDPSRGWIKLGTALNSGPPNQVPSIAFGSDGRPIVAFADLAPGIVISRWNGAFWDNPFPAILAYPFASNVPPYPLYSLIMERSQRPFVAWVDCQPGTNRRPIYELNLDILNK